MAKKQIKFGINPLLSGPSLEARNRGGVPYRELNISDIDVDPSQPRSTFDAEALAELASSIKEHGVLCPILVRVAPGGTYRLIAGERRLRACKLLGKATIPAVVDSEGSDKEILSKQLVENLQRADLNPLERAQAFGRLRDKLKLSVRDVAAHLGVSKSFVQRSLEILALPEDLREALAAGAPESKVLALAAVESRELRKALLEKLDDLTRAQIQHEVDKRSQRKKKVSHRGTESIAKSEDLRLCEEIQHKLGTKVEITRTKGKEEQGRLTVEFYSRDDLQELYRRLSS